MKKRPAKNKSLKEKSPYLSHFEQQLFGKTVPIRVAFAKLQIRGDFKELSAIGRAYSSSASPIHKYIFGIPFAKSFKDIRSSHFFFFTDDIVKEISWVIVSILRYSKELNEFIELSSKFEKEYLLGNFSVAYNILQEVKDRFGYTFWGIEKEFLLKEYSEGLESNKRFLTELIKDESIDILLRFISQFLSERAEALISAGHLKQKFNKFSGLGPEYDEIVKYLAFHIDPSFQDLVSQSKNLIYYEGPSPVIDRYLTFIHVCQSLIVSSPDTAASIAPILSRLDGKIIDSRLERMLQLTNPKRQVQWDELSESILKLLDLYTDGYYDDCLEKCLKLLQIHQYVFELYIIYLYSLGYQGLPFEQIFSSPSPAGRILLSLDQIIRCEPDWRKHLDIIHKDIFLLGRTSLSYGLYSFYVSESCQEDGSMPQQLSILNSTHINPNFSTLYENSNEALIFLESIGMNYGPSDTIALKRSLRLIPSSSQISELPETIPFLRRNIYSAMLCDAAGEPGKAIRMLQDLESYLASNPLPGLHLFRARIAEILFGCYMKTNSLSECADMIVRNYLQNPKWIRKIKIQPLVASIEKYCPPDFHRNIAYPILFSIFYKKPRPIYIAYDNFLSAHGVTRPTQLISDPFSFKPKYLSYFLQNVCTIDVMACSFHFHGGTRDLENERIRICQFLSETDCPNLKAYTDEITSITSKAIIRRGMRQIEESKIYVDEQGIRKSSHQYLEENFARYSKSASLKDVDQLLTLDTKYLAAYHLNINEQGELIKTPIAIDEALPKDIKVVNTFQFSLFKEIFLDIRDRFISSGEYGLDSYLSIRIRHGVLQNQIRSIFESLHLISEKDSATDEYLANPIWVEKLKDIAQDTCESIQQELSVFSKDIDKITNDLNKEVIQVRTEKKHRSGLFDYTFSENEIFDYYCIISVSDIHTCEVFYDKTFHILWDRTRTNLKVIQAFVSGPVKHSLFDIVIHYCPNVSRIDSIAYSPPLPAFCILASIMPVKWGFSRKE